MIETIAWNGQKISRPGIYSNVSMDFYHGDACDGPSISSSGLRTIFYESAAHYFVGSYLNPDRGPEKSSEAFIFGRGAHHLLLGETSFHKHFAMRPETYPPHDRPWNSNAGWCKEWLEVVRDQGRTVLTAGDIRAIRGMADSLAKEPMIEAGVLDGMIEHSFFWKDEETGVWLKWRPDAIPTDDLDFADLKSCASVSDRDIERSVASFGYHAQGSLGSEACLRVLGKDMASFTLVLVEKKPPHCVRFKTIRPADIAIGAEQNRAALRLFKHSLDAGRWLGPGGEQHDAEYVGLSPRAEESIRARINEIERLIA